MGQQWYANAGALVRYVHSDHTPAPVPESVRQQVRRISVDRRRFLDEETKWFDMSEADRVFLVCYCTERPIEGAHRVKWADLTPEQRQGIGAFMRRMARAAELGKGLW